MKSNVSQVAESDILLIDDNQQDQRLLSTILSSQGYKVRTAVSGVLALGMIDAAKPDLILLDIRMPDTSGYKVCQQLKSSERTVDIPIIFISASAEVLDKVKAFEVGGVDYLVKPFEIQEVLVRIKTQLTIYQQKKQLKLQQEQLTEHNTQLQLLLTTAKAISEASDFQSALEATIHQVCEKIGWDFGEFWLPDRQARVFEYGKGWYTSEQNFEQLRQLSEPLLLATDKTFQRRICLEKKPLWLTDVDKKEWEVFFRNHLAGKVGLKTCLGIPILFNDEVLAVLIFFKKEAKQPELGLIELVNFLAMQLGSLIERKRTEERLQLVERAIAASNNGILIADATQPDLPIIYVNPVFESITGYSTSEVIGKNCRFLQGNNTNQAALAEVRAALREKRGCRTVLLNYRKDGSMFWNELYLAPVQDTVGNLTHYIGVQNDVTERKRVKAELKQARERKALFNVISKIRESLELETIFQTTAREVRQFLKADRVGMFYFYPDSHWNEGEFVSEDVLPEFNSALAARVSDYCFGDYASNYQFGKVQAVADIYQAGLSDCHIQVLSRFQVRANLIVPLLKGDQLWGLLCIHQCSCTRQWQEREIEFVQQIATQLGIALQQAELLAQTKRQSMELSQSLGELQQTQVQLANVNQHLEKRVAQRTTELEETLKQLKQEMSDRQQVEERLRLLDRAIEASSNGVIIGDFTQQSQPIIYANQGFERLTGYSAQEVIGKNYRFLPEGQGNQAALEKLHQAIEQGQEAQTILRNYHQDGSLFWSQFSISPVRNTKGRVTHYIGIQTDITARKRAEAALKESEARYRAIFEQAAVGITQVHPDGHLLQANQRFCHLVGYTEAELLHKTVQEVTHREDFRADQENWQRLLTGKIQTYYMEKRFICKNNQQLWTNLAVSLVRDDEGIPKYAIGVIEDINDRKQAEIELVRREEKFRAIFNSALDGILVANDDGFYIDANPAACDLLNLNKEKIVGLDVKVFDQLDQTVDSYNHWQNFLAIGQMRGEFIVCMANDHKRDFEYSAKANYLPGRHLLIFRDVTARKQFESALKAKTREEQEKAEQLGQALVELQRTHSQLVQNEKMVSLGHLVAGVAHEINNPISFISCNIEPASEYARDLLRLVNLYKNNYPQPVAEIEREIKCIDLDFVVTDFPKLLGSMREGANRISEIVLSLRNFSRLDEQDKKQVDIHQGIDNTLLILQHRLKAHSTRPEILVSKEYGQLPLVECYPGQLNQVFMNIISNAIDALESQPAPREMIIYTSVSNGQGEISSGEKKSSTPDSRLPTPSIIVRIVDNGPGLKPEVLSRIFDPFFTTKPPGKGTGLGLSISYQVVVEKHNGQLYCNSVPGQGTEFVIELPISLSRKVGED
ncbi:MAG: PAS domain S-box protein [Coleofasciculaceae cyanobacterium]